MLGSKQTHHAMDSLKGKLVSAEEISADLWAAVAQRQLYLLQYQGTAFQPANTEPKLECLMDSRTVSWTKQSCS